MRTRLKFTVPGTPVAKARPRVTRSGHTYTPAKTVEQERLIQYAFRREHAEPTESPLEVHIRAVMPYPKSMSKKARKAAVWHTRRPDADNLAKTVLDALNGLAYKDDGQVSRLVIEKVYGQEPRTEIEICEVLE